MQVTLTGAARLISGPINENRRAPTEKRSAHHKSVPIINVCWSVVRDTLVGRYPDVPQLWFLN